MRWLLSIALLTLSFLTNAQTIQETVITLKDGSVIKGIKMETNDTATLRLKTRAANELVFQKTEIKNIRHQKVSKSLYHTEEAQTHYKKTGYAFFGNIGLMLGKGNFNNNLIGFNGEIINSYVINPHFSAGIGLASQHFGTGISPYFPLFINARVNLFKKNFTPYLTGSVGWNTPWLIDKAQYDNVKAMQGGRFYQTGIGIRNAFNPHAAYFIQIGFFTNRLKTLEEEIGRWGSEVKKVENIYTRNRITLKVGFQF